MAATKEMIRSAERAAQWVREECGLPCSLKHVRDGYQAGELAYLRWGGNFYFHPDDLRAWVESHRVSAK